MRVVPDDGIRALMKQTPESSPSLLPCEDTGRRPPSTSQEAGSPDTQSAGTLILDLQLPHL